jgi:hypothetical protein
MTVGEMTYDTILVPGCETLRASTVERLEAFRAAGGRLIFLGEAPAYVEAVPSERGRALWARSQAVAFEKEALLANGWNFEGIAFNSGNENEVPQYRLYNPNVTVGAYHFTASIEERNVLLAAGWQDQGIGFYTCWQ